MKVFGLAGWSGSGKTTLLIRLIPEFVARGISVSTIKHAHHGFDIDQPGKDSHAHRMAGAREVMVSSGRRFALMHELRGAPESALEDLVARMSPVDLLLVEGFKHHAHDKLEVPGRRWASRCWCRPTSGWSPWPPTCSLRAWAFRSCPSTTSRPSPRS